MPLILGANSVSGYTVKNSLRFENTSTDGLKRTITTSGNRQIWTWSGWVKRSKLTNTTGDPQILFNAGENTFGILDILIIRFNTDDKFFVVGLSNGGATTDFSLTTNAVYRDVSAWYHVVVAFDTTQATASNRVKIYINGVQETSFSSATYPSLNYNSFVNFVTRPYYGIGDRINTSGQLFAGYMSEIYMIDGQALTPSSFGETDTDTGIWKPKAYTGTFGTNGFYLKFANSASLGTDSSGNGNNFTVNNLTSIDQTTDTPTNNFATLNPLAGTAITSYAEGNNKITGIASSWTTAPSTIAISTGKWFCEAKAQFTSLMIGILDIDQMVTNNYQGSKSNGWGYEATGTLWNNGSATTSWGATYTTGDIIGVALDLDNNKLYFSKNGTWQNSADPSAGTGGISITANKTYYFAMSPTDSTSSIIETNFGNPPFTIASGNADANGYGNFEYAVPSGYYSLCTKNLYQYGF